jgi:ribonuclease VapC
MGTLKLFVETSAMMAILLQEPDWRELAERVRDSDEAFTSSVALLEATFGIRNERGLPISVAYSIVRDFIDAFGLMVVEISPAMIDAAVEGAEKYGSGRHHLNLGDCISYAAAKFHNAAMLYTGKDFARTDLA